MGLCCWMNSAVGGVALVIGLNLLRCLYRIVYPYFVAPLLGQASKLRQHLRAGDWAVVTGATDGIGKAYAHRLASDYKANLVLIGRNPAKLEDVKAEIGKASPDVSIRCLTFDFANSTKPGDYEKLEKEMVGLENFSCLVNAVGIAYSELGPLEQLDRGDELCADLLNVNCLSATLLSRFALKIMKGQGRGAIINISSASGHNPSPFLSVYGATKRYLGYLSELLWLESSESGVEVQEVAPFFVATKMSGMKPSFTCPTPQAYVAEALKTFGNQTSTFGCFSHSLQGELFKLLPHCFVQHLMKKTLLGLMKAQQRRKARQAKSQ